MEKQTDKMMSTLIAIIGLIAVLIFCFVVNAINHDFSDLYEPIRRFDVFYYDKIVEKGYNISGTYVNCSPEVVGMWNGLSVWAFFPFVPLCVKLLNILTFGLIDNYVLAIMLSTTCMGVMLYFLVRFLRLKKVEINYFLIAVLFVFNSFFLFYFNFYTEAMFMMLIAIFLYLCEQKKFLASGIVLAFLTATRVTGAFFVIYLFCKIYNQIQIPEAKSVRGGVNHFKTFFKKIGVILKTPYYFASLAVSLLGLAIFIIVLRCGFGLSPLAFLDAQVGWGKKNRLFIFNIFDNFTSTYFVSIFVILSILFCVYLMIRYKKYFVSLFMLFYIVFITTSSIASADRYILDMLLLTIELYIIMAKYFNKKQTDIPTKQKVFGKIFSISIIVLTLAITVFASYSITMTKSLFY